jgi:hypothetical protein
MSQTMNMRGLIETSVAPEMVLPEAQPLTLTRNFLWVVATCVLSLGTLPLAIAWIASRVLN